MLDKPEALDSIETAIKLDDNNTRAWYNKAKVIQKLGKLDEARNIYFDKIINKSKEDDMLFDAAYFEIANIDCKKGYYDIVVTYYGLIIASLELAAISKPGDIIFNGVDPNDALRKTPLYAAAWYNKGRVLKALGRTTDADAAFAKAKEYTG
jgi:tetratricopeptide (TPR) repeat protein